MNAAFRLRRGDEVRAVWALAVVVLAGGYFGIGARYQAALTSANLDAASLTRLADSNERIVARASALHASERQARADLQRFSIESAGWASTAALLTALESLGDRLRVEVETIEPGRTQADPRERALVGTGLTIRARGHFRDLLSFIAMLPQKRTLLSVGPSELMLAAENQNAASPDIEATLHATLFHFQSEHHAEVHDGTAAR